MKREYEQTQVQQTKQIQKLILSPHMQQALHLLQLPVLELSKVIEEELEQNPLLEYSEEYTSTNDPFAYDFRTPLGASIREEEDLKQFIENSFACEHSLFDFLLQQANEILTNPREKKIAEWIIGHIDADGYLSTPLEEISMLYEVDQNQLEKLLYIIQTFEPIGIAARSVRESFLIQLKHQKKEQSKAFTIVNDYFEEMIHNRIPQIAKSLRLPPSKVRQIIDFEIASLSRRPGSQLPSGHYKSIQQPVIPDILLIQQDKELIIEINQESIPGVRINPNYLKMLGDESLPTDTKNYLEERLSSGKWLLKSIHERHHTLYRIAEQLLEIQKSFFVETKGKLVPLTMKDLAERLALHESTIARAVSNKYISCPKGILPIRSLFTHAYQTFEGTSISSTSVKDLLLKLIQQENKKNPYSDEALSELIKGHGIPFARRTVAKYRQELGVGNANQRKIH